MKILTAVLLLALALGVAPVVFASDVSAADQTDNSLIVKEGSIDARASQTTGEIESGNVSKIDLNVATKPDVTVNVENSTTAEPAKADMTGIAPVQNVGNSTKTGEETNLTNLQSENSQKLTSKGSKSIKAQKIDPCGPIGIGISILFFAWDHGGSELANKALEDAKKQTVIHTKRWMSEASQGHR